MKQIQRHPRWGKGMKYHVEYGDSGLADSGMRGFGIVLVPELSRARLIESVCRTLGIPCLVSRIVKRRLTL